MESVLPGISRVPYLSKTGHKKYNSANNITQYLLKCLEPHDVFHKIYKTFHVWSKSYKKIVKLLLCSFTYRILQDDLRNPSFHQQQL